MCQTLLPSMTFVSAKWLFEVCSEKKYMVLKFNPTVNRFEPNFVSPFFHYSVSINETKSVAYIEVSMNIIWYIGHYIWIGTAHQ